MASPLQAFTQAAFGLAKSIIGTESITIGGGTPISGIESEASFSRNYEAGGFERSGSLEFVIDSLAFIAAYPLALESYEGKRVAARGATWRVGSIKGGGRTAGQFVTISLITENKSA